MYCCFIWQPLFAQERYRWTDPNAIVNLNTPEDDFAPVWSHRDKLLYFNSTDDGYSKFYTARVAPVRGSMLETASLFSNRELAPKTFNADRNNQSFITFARDGSVYFSSFRPTRSRPYLNIYQAARRNNELWEQSEPVPALQSDGFNAHPTLSPSGKFIVFSSDRPGGRGGIDLWIASKDALGEWQTPVNLGEALNSRDDEITPFFTGEDSLYFASNGFGGKGGFEIFLSIRSGSKWLPPVPVNELNSEFDDSDFTVLPHNVGVFASNRPGGRGGFDLYSTRLVTLALAMPALEYKISPQTTFLTVEENSTTENIPLLPCIFFDENTTILPAELRKLQAEETMQYSTTSARPDPQGIYVEILNIIGKRMRDLEGTALIISPFVTESPGAKQAEIARARVESIRAYLSTIWKIDRERLITGTPKSIAEMLPGSVVAGSSSSRTSLRTTILSNTERSRCVELLCTDPRVVAPVQIGGVRLQTKTPRIEIFLDVRPRDFLQSWEFVAQTGVQDTLFAISGKFLPYTTTWAVEPEHLNRLSQEVRLQLRGIDSLGRAGKEDMAINVYKILLEDKRRQKESVKVLEHHRIVLLDEAQKDLSSEQRLYIQSFVNSLTPQSLITVSGYGVAEFNDGKGTQIERFIGLIAQDIKRLQPSFTVKTVFLGETDALTVRAPQERLYSRCVIVTVERKIPMPKE